MKKKIKVGSDFSGVGAFDQALKMLEIDYETVFSCDMDKFARQTYIHNYGEPKYYPENVYNREIPNDSTDIYMTSPPCQAFSLAGKRLGKEALRGLRVLQITKHSFISPYSFEIYELSDKSKEIEFKIAFQEVREELRLKGFRVELVQSPGDIEKILINW